MTRAQDWNPCGRVLKRTVASLAMLGQRLITAPHGQIRNGLRRTPAKCRTGSWPCRLPGRSSRHPWPSPADHRQTSRPHFPFGSKPRSCPGGRGGAYQYTAGSSGRRPPAGHNEMRIKEHAARRWLPPRGAAQRAVVAGDKGYSSPACDAIHRAHPLRHKLFAKPSRRPGRDQARAEALSSRIGQSTPLPVQARARPASAHPLPKGLGLTGLRRGVIGGQEPTGWGFIGGGNQHVHTVCLPLRVLSSGIVCRHNCSQAVTAQQADDQLRLCAAGNDRHRHSRALHDLNSSAPVTACRLLLAWSHVRRPVAPVETSAGTSRRFRPPHQCCDFRRKRLLPAACP
jgi:hypothetical protein